MLRQFQIKEGCQKRFFQLIRDLVIRTCDRICVLNRIKFISFKFNVEHPLLKKRFKFIIFPTLSYRLESINFRTIQTTINNALITRVPSTVVDRAFREGGVRGEKGEEDDETLE